jgi:hypothetical protein
VTDRIRFRAAVKIGVPKETAAGESRVALVPDVVRSLKKNEHVDVLVGSGAGEAAGHPDAQYTEAGAEIAPVEQVWDADVVLKVGAPSAEEIARLGSSQVYVSHLNPWVAADTNKALAASGVTSFAMEAIPRTTRAQAMDALSSQAAAAGYAAMLIAARESGRFFGMMPASPACRLSPRRNASARSSPASTSAAPPGSRSPRSAVARWNWTSSPTRRARAATRARSPTPRTRRSSRRSARTRENRTSSSPPPRSRAGRRPACSPQRRCGACSRAR